MEAIWRNFDHRIAAVIVVVRQQVSADHHRKPVGVAAQDAESAQSPAVWQRERGEHAVACEKEVLAESRRQSGRSERLRLNERNGNERVSVVRLEFEARRQQPARHIRRHRVSQCQALAEVGPHPKGMPPKRCEHVPRTGACSNPRETEKHQVDRNQSRGPEQQRSRHGELNDVHREQDDGLNGGADAGSPPG